MRAWAARARVHTSTYITLHKADENDIQHYDDVYIYRPKKPSSLPSVRGGREAEREAAVGWMYKQNFWDEYLAFPHPYLLVVLPPFSDPEASALASIQTPWVPAQGAPQSPPSMAQTRNG